MSKYNEKISDNSVWVTVTPTPLAMTMPFYVTEAGHFLAENGYSVKRSRHDSHLLLYTLGGSGRVCTDGNEIQLPRGRAVIIDCRAPHEYYSSGSEWEFLWVHICGSGVGALFNAVYPNMSVRAVNMEGSARFESGFSELTADITRNGVAGCIKTSSRVHELLNCMCVAALEGENASGEREIAKDIRSVITFIEENYARPVSVDDMIKNIHVSKYHFIRRFRRAMGVTPYSWLTNYRINMSKMLLRSTDKTVSEIAGECGFLDTSNFIAQFKKHTGEKPLQYRRDFSGNIR